MSTWRIYGCDIFSGRLREKGSAEHDTELDSQLLARRLETVLGRHQEWERQLAEACEREQNLRADLWVAKSRAV